MRMLEQTDEAYALALWSKPSWVVGIDEIAILVDGHHKAMEEILDFVQSGHGVFFNMAGDQVLAKPFGDRYSVVYRFLQPHGRNYRIELMTLESGHSPAHDPFLADLGESPDGRVVVHASWKVPDRPNMTSGVSYDIERRALRSSSGLWMVQECESTYGRFSYWKKESSPFYFKPRVNLRDAS